MQEIKVSTQKLPQYETGMSRHFRCSVPTLYNEQIMPFASLPVSHNCLHLMNLGFALFSKGGWFVSFCPQSSLGCIRKIRKPSVQISLNMLGRYLISLYQVPLKKLPVTHSGAWRFPRGTAAVLALSEYQQVFSSKDTHLKCSRSQWSGR